METILHAYCFDVRTAEGKSAWQAFKAEREASGARIMGPVYHTGNEATAFDGATITLETAHLFDNQWNAAGPGRVSFRAFDWLLEAERPHYSSPIGAPRGIRRGYWLEQTEAMRTIRRETLKCGYCGHYEPAANAPTFCPACIGSEYLKPADFHLTRLVPVADSGPGRKFPPISEAEQAERLALWQDAQREGAKTRAGEKLRKFRAAVEAKAAKAVEHAERERAGMLWLLDNDLGGLAADNCIFYPYTGRFSFGWRTKIEGALAHELIGQLSDKGFPFPYDFQTVDLGKLSGAVED